jgi:DNA methylase/Restriction endonuclease
MIIIWKRTSAHSGESKSRRSYGSIHDVILFYSKTDIFTFNLQYVPYDTKHVEDSYEKTDKDGRTWTSSDLMAAGVRQGESGKPWRGIDPAKRGNHWKFTVQKLDELDKQGRIYFPKKVGGVPRYIRYLDEMAGVLLQDIWVDIPPVSSHAKERLGFQTQKPLKLLERIINSCTKEGDLILDPFCGCGTAVVAAQNLHRPWIGIDVTMLAINLMNRRLNDMFSGIQVRIDGEPTDIESATHFALKDRHEFQRWALLRIGAVPVGATATNPNKVKKGADEGYDGWMRFQDGPNGRVEKILVQVRSGHVHLRDIRDFRDVVTSKSAAMGIFITLEPPTGDMIKSVKTTDPYISNLRIEYPKLQIITVSELLGRKNLQLPSIISPFEEAIATKRLPHHKPSKLL